MLITACDPIKQLAMKKMFACIALCMGLINNMTAQIETGEQFAVTQTEAGSVRGYRHHSIYTYKGIPYASAKRFETPQKTAPWQGIRSSMTYGPVAPLVDPTVAVQDESEFVFHHDWGYTNENCLVLNVWTPGLNDGKKRPVLFWIHGGGFTAGSSQELPSYDGEQLAATGDVVVVSINHRLNILGFLDLSAYGEKYAHSANNSILDIKAALEWVQKNITHFGGDPGNVTIFGQSGGGAKVNTLMAMPSVKGLFHKAVNESGAFKTTLPDKSITQAIAAEVLKNLNITPDHIDSIQKVPFENLVKAGKLALKTVSDNLKATGKIMPGMGLGWAPSLDGTDIPYTPGSPEALQVSKDIPLLIGTVKNEFSVFMNSSLTHASREQVMAAIQQRHPSNAAAWVAAVKKAYPNDTLPSDLLDVDVMFRPGAVVQANQKAAMHAAPVYMYLFTWQSPVMDGKYKAVHCMELPFVFNNIAKCEEMTGGGKEAYRLADKMSKAWIQFARTGDPNHGGLPNWPAYTEENTATMHFDKRCEVLPQMDKDLFELNKIP